MDICPKCGLPKDLCVCDILEKEQTENIVIYLTTSKFRKVITVVEGVDKKKLVSTAKELKHALACGGTVKGENIILQGDHRKRVKDFLVKSGYKREHITVEDVMRKSKRK